MNYHILVVEDEIEIANAIEIYLKTQNYTVYKALNGQQGLEIIENNEIHLAIVDIMMPVMDGISMVMKVREKYEFPILFLSAKSEDIDKITGLNIGADDYITKPFVPMELLARVSSHLRRYGRYLEMLSGSKTQFNGYVIGGLELNLDSREVTVDDKSVKVTPIEFGILELLMSHPGRVFSAEQIYESVWKEEAIATETVMVHIRNLREKIEIDPKNPRYIKVVWGVGYKMEIQEKKR
ncbi:MAG: response regulator transcription factor [Erysipelotrichaceae bacterium]|nr:response regulator transcription factor [Erysipelotrichaceae bacterium]